MENRRQFTRILFSIKAKLEVEDNFYPVTIHDISLNGALVTSPDTNDALARKLGVLTFQFEGGSEEITMHIAVVHAQGNEMGLRVNAIDIDSISQLRRMVELNLGDAEQLNKELSQLTMAQ
ncbi:MAG: PilZ domain-containing protein [Thalassotalea sp.]